MMGMFVDFHAPVDIGHDTTAMLLMKHRLYYVVAQYYLIVSRFKFVVDADEGDTVDLESVAVSTLKCRRQPERNRSISVNLS